MKYILVATLLGVTLCLCGNAFVVPPNIVKDVERVVKDVKNIVWDKDRSSAPRFGHRRCVINGNATVTPVIKSPLPHEYVKSAQIPRSFNWGNVNGRNYLTPSRNQHIPQYCGSCWAMASTVALADRIKIMRDRVFPDYMLAVQHIVYCKCNGCEGGDASTVYQYIHESGIPVDSCLNYVAEGTGNECTALHTCENCMPGAPCYAIKDYTKFGASEHGQILGIHQMKAEIFKRGPIACAIDADPVYEWGFGPDRTGIFTDGQGKTNIDHAISVTGFGYDSETNTDYWIIRNSWGEYWGDNGFFKLKMGDNQLGIESTQCSWAVPTLPKAVIDADEKARLM